MDGWMKTHASLPVCIASSPSTHRLSRRRGRVRVRLWRGCLVSVPAQLHQRGFPGHSCFFFFFLQERGEVSRAGQPVRLLAHGITSREGEEVDLI